MERGSRWFGSQCRLTRSGFALLRELLTAHGWPVRTTPVAMLQGGLRALEQLYGEERQETAPERRIQTHHARTAARHGYSGRVARYRAIAERPEQPEGDKGDKGDTHHVGELRE